MTLVKKTFFVFIVAFGIQIRVIALLVSVGYRQSANQWSATRYRQAERTAVAVLTADPALQEDLNFPGQIAIYDHNDVLLATNRGMGMRAGMMRNLGTANRIPVFRDGQQLGSYAIGDVAFEEDSANKALLHTMGRILIVSLVLAFGISLLAALYFSHLVSRPADQMARSLQALGSGELGAPIIPQGAQEIRRIGHSIESLRVGLLREQTVRTQWSQDLAHDLRSPVASMKAQLEGMADGILPATPQRFARAVEDLGRMETLIDDLETLMRLESPETHLNPVTVDTEAFAAAAKRRFEVLAAPKEINIRTLTDRRPFVADESLLFRAVSNLLSNAVRHCDQGGEVLLSVESGGGETRIAVGNTGAPIPTHEVPKLFERLYRGEYARNTPGSGLGLTIVDRIARLHHGSVAVQSGPERHTTFTMVLKTSVVADSEEA